MLSFDIRTLESHAVVVDEDLPASDPVWEDDDRKPEDAIHVTGRLSAAGPGRFYWHGRIEGDVAHPHPHRESCHEAHIIFAESGDENTTEDPDVYELDPRALELDLRPAIREEWLLAAPSFALCREDCKGLCPRCGADLNDGSHDCSQQEADPRWDALRKLKKSSK